MVTPSGRSVTECATARPEIGPVYFGTRNDSARSCIHLIGHDQSSSRPSSVPIAMARRPTAARYIPGRASPRSSSGEVPSGKSGMVVVVVSTAFTTGGTEPGARGRGFCAAPTLAQRTPPATASTRWPVRQTRRPGETGDRAMAASMPRARSQGKTALWYERYQVPSRSVASRGGRHVEPVLHEHALRRDDAGKHGAYADEESRVAEPERTIDRRAGLGGAEAALRTEPLRRHAGDARDDTRQRVNRWLRRRGRRHHQTLDGVRIPRAERARRV